MIIPLSMWLSPSLCKYCPYYCHYLESFIFLQIVFADENKDTLETGTSLRRYVGPNEYY